MGVQNYRDLKVWQLGMEVALDAYRATQAFPKNEVYGLNSQIQRSAVSLPANIAEGHERSSTKEFLRHISIAHGSRAELETHLLLAERLGYCKSSDLIAFFSKLEELGKMLRGLQKSLRRKIDEGGSKNRQ